MYYMHGMRVANELQNFATDKYMMMLEKRPVLSGVLGQSNSKWYFCIQHCFVKRVCDASNFACASQCALV